MQSFLGWTTLLVGAVTVAAVALREPKVASPLWAAYLVRAAVALTHVYVFSITGGKGDAVRFLSNATAWSRDGVVSAFLQFHAGAQVYAWLLSLLFAISSPSELMALAINVLFGALVTFNVWRLALSTTSSEQLARSASWCAALFPSLILFSAMTVREAAVIYPLTLGLRYLVSWWKDGKARALYCALGAFTVSAAFHPGMAIFIAATAILLLARWATALVKFHGDVWMRATIGGLVLAIVGGIAVGTRAGLEKFGNKLTIEAISDQQQGAARSRAAYLQGRVPNSPIEMISQIPVRIVYFLFTPFPWMVHSPGDVIALGDAVVYLLALGTMLRAWQALWRDPPYRALAFAFLVGIIPFAVSTSNYGTAVRHRAKFAPLVFVLCFAARAKMNERDVLGRAGPATAPVPQPS